MPTIRRKTSSGITISFRYDQDREGRWRVKSASKASLRGNPVPLALVPFEISNAVINSPRLGSQGEIESFIHNL